MAANFPGAPVIGSTYVVGQTEYTWSGSAWLPLSVADGDTVLLKSGGTLTGPLTLSDSPTGPNEATNKSYVDTNFIPNSLKGVANGIATLDNTGKIPLSELSDSVLGQLEYTGTWDANTNTPTLPATPLTTGQFYIVSVAGTQFGITFGIGDWVIASDGVWEQVQSTQSVSSVAGKTGVVTLEVADVSGAVPDTRTVASGTGLTGGGTLAANRTLALTGQALAMHNLATTGLVARTGAGTVAGRTITNGTGISISNGDGVSDNPVITNAAPDQVVSLTQGGATTITGVYPSFTISSVNTTYSPGTGISITDTTIANTAPHIATNLSLGSSTGTAVRVDSSTGNNVSLPVASATLAGVVTNAAQTFAGVKTFSSTITGSVSGSAATLTTARTINGTSFNGSANITTANWGTSRTLTIGSSGKAVTGGANVSWSLDEMNARARESATVTSVNKTLVRDEYCTVTAAGLTITLPASPAAGHTVRIGVLNFANTIVARNSQNIMGLPENMTIDAAYANLRFTFVDATYGWMVS